jgi:hypothetical protein
MGGAVARCAMPTFHPNGHRTSVGDPGLATMRPSRRWGTRLWVVDDDVRWVEQMGT